MALIKDKASITSNDLEKKDERSADERLNQLESRLDDLQSVSEEQEKSVNENKELIEKNTVNLQKETARSVAVIGTISSIIGLLIVDVSIIQSSKTFLAAILLITSLTVSFVIMVSFFKSTFSFNEDKSSVSFNLGVFILVVVLFIGIITYILGYDLYKEPTGAGAQFVKNVISLLTYLNK